MALLDYLVPRNRIGPQKAATGIGAAWVESGLPMLSTLQRSPQKMMAEAQALYHRNLHIRSAERLVDQLMATVPWHLEVDGEAIDDDSPPNLKAIRDLFETPYQPKQGEPESASPKTRAKLWTITGRHMGLCGPSFWYLDQTNALGGIPLQLLYINPARMTPAPDKQGNLMGWVLDADARGNGTPLELTDVVSFQLEPPDQGFLASGLVEAVLSKANLSNLAERHAAGVLSSGGRLAGVMSPKGDTAVIPPEVFEQLVRDIRTVNESPDAAKRMLVLRGPIDFTRTSATPSELQLMDLFTSVRDDILELWGVPASQLGIQAPAGLNSGNTKSFDEAVLWQNAVGPRLDTFVETIQYQLLDRWQEVGINVQLVVEPPEFDDRQPKFELAKLAESMPLRNVERRELAGYDPFGDPVLDNAVWVPLNIDEKVIAPDLDGNPVEQPEPPPPNPFAIIPPAEGVPAQGAPPLFPAKARLDTQKLRDAYEPALERAIGKVLRAMGQDVAARVRSHYDHLTRKPTDVQTVFDQKRWQAALEAAMKPHVVAIAEATGGRVEDLLGKSPGKADLSDRVLSRLLAKVGLRIKGITDYTRERIADIIATGIDQGWGAAQLGDAIEAGAPFNELRAETIARTETGTVLNLAATEQYAEFGVTHVHVDDGDGDDICAAADGQTWTLDEAESDPLGHPNCVRSFSPVIP